MRKTLLLFMYLCCFCWVQAYADWTVSQPAQIAPLSPSSTYYNVYVSCNPATGEFLAAWADLSNNNYPTYSFYTPNSGWGQVNTISTSSQAMINVVVSYNSEDNTFLATWTDSNTQTPTYALYSANSGWSPASTISNSSLAVRDTTNLYDSTTGMFIATWGDPNNSFYPTYSFFTSETGWSTAAPISMESPTTTIHTSLNDTNGTILATWTDIDTGYPIASFYSSGEWSPFSVIASTTGVDNDTFSACNPTTGQFLAVWADINNNFYPTYSVYTPGSGWSPMSLITSTSGVVDNVTISFDSVTAQYLALWNDVNTGYQTYSFYNQNSGWSSPAIISNTSSAGDDIIPAFNPNSGEFFVTWTNSGNETFVPMYSIFFPPQPPPLLNKIVRKR